jgi:hypothetical protein
VLAKAKWSPIFFGMVLGKRGVQIEIHCCRESDFGLQRLVECTALETERVRLVVLR